MLKACYYSLDLKGQYGSPFLNLITKNPESPIFAIYSSFLFKMEIIAVAEPTAFTLAKALLRTYVG